MGGLMAPREKNVSSGDREVVAMQKALAALDGLEPEEQARVHTWLAQKLKLSASVLSASQAAAKAAAEVGKGSGAGLKPKDFIRQKQPATGVERIACLAYYLTHHRQQETFKTKDLTALNTEAAQPRLSNAAFDVRNATSQNQYLAPAGKGAKRVTGRGEAMVEALPDREAVKKALDDNPLAGRGRRGKKKKKAAAK